MYKTLAGEVLLCQFWYYSKQKLKRRASIFNSVHHLVLSIEKYWIVLLLP